MISLRPFPALHYNLATIGDLASVIAPPYDVIDDAAHARLWARSPHNVVRLILNREPDRYAAAAATLAAWREAGMLVQDPQPCFYDYVQDFGLPDGSRRQRAGLIAAVRLESFDAGNIRPHERTFARAKEDRLRLLEACRANLSPIFGIYPHGLEVLDALRADRREAPWIDVTDDRGERHRLWRVHDRATIGMITDAARDLTVFIADGHHRYETALAYRDQRRATGATDPDARYNFVLMYLAAMNDPGLVILPTHRVLRRLPEGAGKSWIERLRRYFTIEEVSSGNGGRRDLLAQLDERDAAGLVATCLATPERRFVLRARDTRALAEALGSVHPTVRRLDVTLLDALVLRQTLGVDPARAAQDGLLEYTHDGQQAIEAVTTGHAAAAFLLRAPRIEDVQAVCVAGQTVPEKSTYFYPKLMSGLVFHVLDDGPRARHNIAPPLTTTA